MPRLLNKRSCAAIHQRARAAGRTASLAQRSGARSPSARGVRCDASVTEVQPERLLEVAHRAAKAGEKIITSALDKPRVISIKGASSDIVTETDKASEDAVMKVLMEAFPDHAFLGEEGGVSGDVRSEYLWCVDPLDGTTNFAHSYPSFAVSVGVLHRSLPVAGCVIEFTGGPHAWGTRTFTAFKKGGAFCNGQRIQVSNVDDVTKSLLITGFGYDHDAAWSANMDTFKELTDVSQGVRRLGAAAVDLCHVSMGIAEAYWEYRLKPWDVCAGMMVLEEARGVVTTMEGKPPSVFARSFLATNSALHNILLEYTAPKTRALIEKGVDLSSYYQPKGYPIHTPSH